MRSITHPHGGVRRVHGNLNVHDVFPSSDHLAQESPNRVLSTLIHSFPQRAPLSGRYPLCPLDVDIPYNRIITPCELFRQDLHKPQIVVFLNYGPGLGREHGLGF
jgi:hypothetical protein